MELDIEKMSETELWEYVESLRDNGDLRKGCEAERKLLGETKVGKDFLGVWEGNPTEQEILEKIKETGGEILIGAPLEFLSDREFMLKAVDVC